MAHSQTRRLPWFSYESHVGFSSDLARLGFRASPSSSGSALVNGAHGHGTNEQAVIYTEGRAVMRFTAVHANKK